jgi:hypothetical protein
MQAASRVLHPADDKILPSSGEQHDLPLPALDEMDPAALVQRDGFSQDQRSPGAGLRPPDTKLQQSCCPADQRDDANQNCDNEQYGLRGHPDG